MYFSTLAHSLPLRSTQASHRHLAPPASAKTGQTRVTQPLILTLQLDETTQAFYEDLRHRYFPPERNLIPAHLTLFHHLPDDDHTAEAIGEASQSTTAFSLTNPDARSIGRGVAVFFQSERLRALHAALSTAFEPDLIPQDRQRFQPHIVVQNKVAPETARQTLPQIQGISLWEPHAIGLTLWRYLGGPWERVSDFPFDETA